MILLNQQVLGFKIPMNKTVVFESY